MITLPAYTFLHIVAAFLVFFGFGMSLFQNKVDEAARKTLRLWTGVLHGAGLLLLLVAGFGLLARMGIHWPWPGWVWGKVLIWLALGFMIAVYKREWAGEIARMGAVLGLGALAVYLAIFKPF